MYSDILGMPESTLLRMMIKGKGLKWIEEKWVSEEKIQEYREDSEASSNVINSSEEMK